MLPLCLQQQVPLGESIPEGMERLVETDVVVPRFWLAALLSKCKGKGGSFTVKKFLDGFFEPEDLVDQTASKMLRTSAILRAIRGRLTN